MAVPPVEVSHELVRQQVVDRLKAPEYPLAYTEITGIPVALFTATSVYSTILGRHRTDGQSLGGTRSLDPASITIPLDTSSRNISHLANLTGTIPIGLGSAMTDKYTGLFAMYKMLHREGFVDDAAVQAVRRGGRQVIPFGQRSCRIQSFTSPRAGGNFFSARGAYR